MLEPIVIPKDFNYIGAFLTLACRFDCPWCINRVSGFEHKSRWMNKENWIKGLNRIATRPNLPITLSGGEPTLHRGIYDIIHGVKHETSIDLLTNLDFDLKEFRQKVWQTRLSRDAPYASIRVSYHHGQSHQSTLLKNVRWLMDKGYNIGLFIVDLPNPEIKEQNMMVFEKAKSMGIDVRWKEFLGEWKGEMYGTYRFPGSVNSGVSTNCVCHTSELLIGPAGNLFRCHADLYADRNSIGHILDTSIPGLSIWRDCSNYGNCNPCDVKVKNNRFQEFGHTSVEIKTTPPSDLARYKSLRPCDGYRPPRP